MQTTRWDKVTGTGAVVGSPFHARMVEMRLHQNELELFDQIMSTPGKLWPEGLADSLESKTQRVGLCMEVVVEHVADWIRSARVEHYSPSNCPKRPGSPCEDSGSFMIMLCKHCRNCME